MISKEKTIAKALNKYKEIYPMKNRTSFEECFFYLHGEILFVFRTKKMKIKTLKAVRTPPIIQAAHNNSNFLTSIYKILTKPISFNTLVEPTLARMPIRGQTRSN